MLKLFVYVLKYHKYGRFQPQIAASNIIYPLKIFRVHSLVHTCKRLSIQEFNTIVSKLQQNST